MRKPAPKTGCFRIGASAPRTASRSGGDAPTRPASFARANRREEGKLPPARIDRILRAHIAERDRDRALPELPSAKQASPAPPRCAEE